MEFLIYIEKSRGNPPTPRDAIDLISLDESKAIAEFTRNTSI